MPIYEVDGPNGGVFEVEAPEGWDGTLDQQTFDQMVSMGPRVDPVGLVGDAVGSGTANFMEGLASVGSTIGDALGDTADLTSQYLQRTFPETYDAVNQYVNPLYEGLQQAAEPLQPLADPASYRQVQEELDAPYQRQVPTWGSRAYDAVKGTASFLPMVATGSMMVPAVIGTETARQYQHDLQDTGQSDLGAIGQGVQSGAGALLYGQAAKYTYPFFKGFAQKMAQQYVGLEAADVFNTAIDFLKGGMSVDEVITRLKEGALTNVISAPMMAAVVPSHKVGPDVEGVRRMQEEIQRRTQSAVEEKTPAPVDPVLNEAGNETGAVVAREPATEVVAPQERVFDAQEAARAANEAYLSKKGVEPVVAEAQRLFPESDSQPVLEKATEVAGAMRETLTSGRPIELTATPAVGGERRATLELGDTNNVDTNPEIFQVRDNTEAKTGVKNENKIRGKWDNLKAGAIITFEPLPENRAQYGLAGDKTRLVVDGHHRHYGATQREVPRYLQFVLREADGWTPELARIYGAEINISQGSTSSLDTASIFRGLKRQPGGVEAAAAIKANIGQKGRRGRNIADYGSDRLFNEFRNGRLSDATAEAIALAAPNKPEPQDVGIDSALKGKSDSKAIDDMKGKESGEDPIFTDIVSQIVKTRKAEHEKTIALLASLKKSRTPEQTAALEAKFGKEFASKRPQLLVELADAEAEMQRLENFRADPDLRMEIYKEAQPLYEAAKAAAEKEATRQVDMFGNEAPKAPEQPSLLGQTVSAAVPAARPRQERAVELYHGSNKELTALEPREVKDVDSMGSWLSSREDGARMYGDKVHRARVDASRLKLLEANSEDFYKFFGSNADIAEAVGLKKEAAALRKLSPDSAKLKAIQKKLESSEGWTVPNSDVVLMKKLRKAEEISRKLLKNPQYAARFKEQLASEGYDGIVWKNSLIDRGSGDKPHDVYLLFNKAAIPTEIVKPHSQKTGNPEAGVFTLPGDIAQGVVKTVDALFEPVRTRRAFKKAKESGAVTETELSQQEMLLRGQALPDNPLSIRRFMPSEMAKKVYEKVFVLPSTVARRDSTFKQVYDAGRDMIKEADSRTLKFAESLKPYLDLKDPKRVDEYLAAARIAAAEGKVMEESSAKLAELKFKPEEIKAIQAVRKTMDDVFSLIEQTRLSETRRAGDTMVREVVSKAAIEAEKLFPNNKEAQQDYIKEKVKEVSIDKGKLIAGTKKQLEAMRAERYVPFSRKGEHYVHAPSENFFSLYESKGEAKKAAAKLAAKGVKGIDVGQMPTPTDISLTGLPRDLMLRVAEMHPEAVGALLPSGVNSKGFSKHFMKANLTEGFRTDFKESLFDYINAASRFAAKRAADPKVEAALDALKKNGSTETANYGQRWWDYINGPSAEMQKLRSALFHIYLGANVKTALVNLTQTMTTTYPALSRYSKKASVDTIMAIKDAGRYITGRKMLEAKDPELVRALDRAIKEGVVSDAQLRELGAEAKGVSPELRTLSKISSFMMAKAETFNRMVALAARFKAAKREGLDFEQALKKAEEFVDETQFIYGKVNRPEIARGAFGATAFTFRLWTGNYLAILRRAMEEKDVGTGVRMLGVMMGLAGVSGMPFVKDFFNVAQTAGYDLRTEIRKMVRDNIPGEAGGKVADAIQYGILASVTPWNISGSVSSGETLPGLDEGAAEAAFKAILGVSGDLPVRAKKAIEAIKMGNNERAMELLSPQVIQNFLKTYHADKYGITTMNGTTVVPREKLTRGELAGMAFGVQPTVASKAYDRQRAEKKINDADAALSKRFGDRLKVAISRNDMATVGNVMREATTAGYDKDMVDAWFAAKYPEVYRLLNSSSRTIGKVAEVGRLYE